MTFPYFLEVRLSVVAFYVSIVACQPIVSTDNSGAHATSNHYSRIVEQVGPAEPCAMDENADLHHNSDVSQVTGRVSPDFGCVPTGEVFNGNPAAQGPYDIYTENVQIPISPGTISIDGMEITVKAGTLSGAIFGPSSDGGCSIIQGAFPLVLLLPGNGVKHIKYETYSKHFASHGFAVLAVDTRTHNTMAIHDQEAFEAKQCLDWIDSPQSPLYGFLDMSKIVAAGHSKGGKVAFFLAALDSRVDFVVAWDPSNCGGPPCFVADQYPNLTCNRVPVAPNCEINSTGLLHYIKAESLVIGMPRDGWWNPDRHHNSIHFYRGAPSPATLVFLNKGHIAPMCNPAVINLNKQIHMAVLLDRMMGMTGLDDYLPTTQQGEAALEQKWLVLRVENK